MRKMHWRAGILGVGLLVGAAAQATAQVVIEPDNYPEGTELTSVVPGVRLGTAGADNQIFDVGSDGEPDFPITAVTPGPFSTAPTGDKVFAHVGIDFFSNARRFRADFGGVTDSVQILFAGDSTITEYTGRLEAYDVNDMLIGSYETLPLLRGETELMSVDATGIAWMVAWTSSGEFGILDAFGAGEIRPVPEPTWAAGATAIAMLLCLRRR